MTTKAYRYISISFGIIFGLVGITFLFMGDEVMVVFNRISAVVGMEQVEPVKGHFFGILAAAYMYVVALLALLMYRNPKEPLYPFILLNAKMASAVISFMMFLTDKYLLIYISNGIVDGLIGWLVFFMYRYSKRNAASMPIWRGPG